MNLFKAGDRVIVIIYNKLYEGTVVSLYVSENRPVVAVKLDNGELERVPVEQVARFQKVG